MSDDPRVFSAGRLSRRSLISTAGAAGLAAGIPALVRAQDATPVATPAASPIPGVIGTLPASWDQELDVVVVGSGGAAFAAAVTAQSNGAKVALFEKGGEFGGVTAKSGGEYWIPNNSLMKAKGLDDPRDDAIKYMIRLAYPSLYDPDLPNYGVGQLEFDLIATFYDTGSVAVDYFAKIGALQSQIQASFGLSEKPDIADPDYSAQLPEDKAPYGRGLNPAGEAGAGVGLIRQMQAYAKQNGLDVTLNARAVGLFQNRAGEVVGVQLESGGKQMAVRAKKGVIFGSGGFTQDPEKVIRFLRGPIFGGCAVPTNTGDFIDIGSAVGAQLGNMSNAFWVENVVEQALDNPSLVAEAWMLFGDSMVVVNKYGQRVVNEKTTYNERTQAHFYWNSGLREYSNLVLFMIFDSAVMQSTAQWPFRWPVPTPDSDMPGYLIQGDTWDDLAKNIDDRLNTLRGRASVTGRIGPDVKLADTFVQNLGQTIERFNGFAQSGKDEDFQRGEAPIEKAWGGPPREGNTGNSQMFPFKDSGPYYAIILGGGTLDTKGGPVIDTGARVLHVNGNPIPGLYGAGNCISSPAGQAYWSGGGTIGPAITFGYIAGKNAAAESERSLD